MSLKHFERFDENILLQSNTMPEKYLSILTNSWKCLSSSSLWREAPNLPKFTALEIPKMRGG